MLDAIAGADIGAPYAAPLQVHSFLQEVNAEPRRLRIAFTAHPLIGHTVHDDCKKGLEATVRLLQHLGHEVIEATPKIEIEAFAIAFLTIIAAETRAEIEQAAQFVKHRPALADFDVTTYAVGMIGQALGATDYAKAARYLQTAGREIGRFFEQYDVLLTPTLSQPPVPIGALQPSSRERTLIRLIGSLKAHWILNALGVVKQLAAQTFDFIPYTPPFNVTGQPAMSAPLYWNEAGLPVGMHFVGRFGDEATLFRLAGQIERAQPWVDRAPAGFVA
jgi:amidase